MALKIVRRRLKDGTVKEYRYGVPGPRTVGAIILEYQKSPAWRALASTTKRNYNYGFDHVRALETAPIDAIRRRHILRQRDALADRPGLAHKVLAAWSVLLAFAVEREYIPFNPATGIKKPKTGEHGRWSDAAIDFALTLREPVRRAVLLALYTGQRASDLVKMTWGDYDGEGITVRQEKTGERLWIPVHSVLKAELDAWEKTSTHILTTAKGGPWLTTSFIMAMSTAFRAHPELNGCVFHGLRKTAAARLAEAGCPPHQIGAITGHKSLAMLMHYTKEASQRQMATAAIERLENIRKTGKSGVRNLLKSNGKA